MAAADHRSRSKTAFESAITTTMIVLGYIFFAVFISGEHEDDQAANRNWPGEGDPRSPRAEGEPDRPYAEIHDKILAAARAFGPQLDDQTLLLARVR